MRAVAPATTNPMPITLLKVLTRQPPETDYRNQTMDFRVLRRTPLVPIGDVEIHAIRPGVSTSGRQTRCEQRARQGGVERPPAIERERELDVVPDHPLDGVPILQNVRRSAPITFAKPRQRGV